MNRFIELFEELKSTKKTSVFSSAKSTRFSAQKSPALIIPAVGVGWKILTDIFGSNGGINWKLQRLEGAKHPWDNKTKYGVINFNPTPIKIDIEAKDYVEWLVTDDRISSKYELRFKYNGHSVGYIDVQNIGNNDAKGAALEVTNTIQVDPTTYKGDIAAIDVVFHFRFTFSVSDDTIVVKRYKLFGNGTYKEEIRETR